jgi:hypothetical protein
MVRLESGKLDEMPQESLSDDSEVTRADVMDASRRHQIASAPMKAVAPVEELQPGVAQESNDRSWEPMNHTHAVHGLGA